MFAIFGIGMVFLLVLSLFVFIYFIPTIMAHNQCSSNMTAVVLINIFLGWTMLGWLAALVLALIGESDIKARRHREILEALKQKNLTQKNSDGCI